MSLKRALIGAGFAALSLGGLHRLTPPAWRGRGAILTLHRVRPWRPATPGYAPNALLEVTPDFLVRALTRVRELGFEFVSLTEIPARLIAPEGRRFVALTFDDGYRDFVDYALPILERFNAPATLFLCPGMIDASAQLWWLQLEAAIGRLDAVEISGETLAARTPEEKSAAYERVYWRLRARPEAELLETCRDLAQRAGVSDDELRAGLFLDGAQLQALAERPGVAFGAHGRRHLRLAHWPEEIARDEIGGSKAALEAQFGRAIEAFSYPVGDATSAGEREFALARACGFRLAVTTRPGLVFAEHARFLHALPRVSLNGLWQDERCLDALLSGAAFQLWNRGRRLDVD